MASAHPSCNPRAAASPQTASDEGSRRALVIAVAFGLLGLWIARSFMLPIVCGLMIATALWPVYQRCLSLGDRARSPTAMALAFTLAAGVLLLLPLAMTVADLETKMPVLTDRIGSLVQHGLSAPNWLAQTPVIGPHMARWWQNHLADPTKLQKLLGSIDPSVVVARASAIVTGVGRTSIFLIITLLAVYYGLRHGSRLSRRAYGLAERQLGDYGRRFADHVTNTIRGVVNGTVLVALGEGALIGFGYAAAGAPEPLLLTILTIVFALLPLGAWVVVSVASLILFMQGHVIAASALFGWGMVVMLVGDHIVQPKLVGGAARLSFLWALVAVLGGVDAFGLVGLFLGPVIMSTVAAIWEMQTGVDGCDPAGMKSASAG